MSPRERATVVIQPPTGWPSIDLGELWRYRELLAILALRDVRARYKQTVLGVLWVVIQPLVTVGVFTVLFGLLLGSGRLPTVAGAPYALSTLCGLLPWTLFATTVSQATGSLVDNRGLITRVYFPRLLVPAAPVVGSLIDFAIGCVVFLLLAAFYSARGDFQFQASWALAALPLFLLLAVAFALAVSMWLSALAAIYRDVKYVLPFLIQLLFFITPVVYAADVVVPRMPPWSASLFSLNPMVGIIEGVRWSLFSAVDPPGSALAVSVVLVLALLVGGLYYFRRMEKTFADVV